MDKLTFGERISHLERHFHMTDEDLARKIPLAKRTLQSYKNDPANMPYWVIQRLCKVFSVSVEYLMEGKDTQELYQETLRMIRSAMKMGGTK